MANYFHPHFSLFAFLSMHIFIIFKITASEFPNFLYSSSQHSSFVSQYENFKHQATNHAESASVCFFMRIVGRNGWSVEKYFLTLQVHFRETNLSTWILWFFMVAVWINQTLVKRPWIHEHLCIVLCPAASTDPTRAVISSRLLSRCSGVSLQKKIDLITWKLRQ